MKVRNVIFICLLTGSAAFGKVSITFQNGAVRNLDSLTVLDGRISLPGEAVQPPLSQVTSAQFSFDSLSLKKCRQLFENHDYAELENKLGEQQASLIAGAALPGNAGDYLLWLLRVYYHSGETAGFNAVMQALQSAGLFKEETGLYWIMALLDEGQTDEAKKLVQERDFSGAAGELIAARLAYAAGDLKSALQHLARLQAFEYRQPEWLPAALFYEALIDQETGASEAKKYAVRELETLYPSDRWSLKAKEELTRDE